ncbi:hypothetical protein [Streptomyces sp. CBMA152]|uniref:hypothetical protein n=1 Tax=Streptomyces sp. CBMA152 TaxID=1896312 RepID=UPI001661483B|nr:hypothetical protein [Streptomyces sp. CBMA152]
MTTDAQRPPTTPTSDEDAAARSRGETAPPTGALPAPPAERPRSAIDLLDAALATPSRPAVPPKPSVTPTAGPAAPVSIPPRLPAAPPAYVPGPRPMAPPAASADTQPPAVPTSPPPIPAIPPLIPVGGDQDAPDVEPVRHRRAGRVVAAAVCLVLGLGLIGGAAAGSWIGSGSGDGDSRTGYTAARDLWHNVPVDTFFPPTISGNGAGPGGADRVWTRVGVAPDGGCAGALDPLLLKVLQPVGCVRLLRATYTDATSSAVTTVGMVFTEADAAAMAALRTRFSDESLGNRSDLMPRPYPVKGTPAAGFGDKQRASWTVRVLTDAPVVVYSVTGYADARTVTDPQPADRAVADGATDAPVEAGLTHDAKGIADRVERTLRKTAATGTKKQR